MSTYSHTPIAVQTPIHNPHFWPNGRIKPDPPSRIRNAPRPRRLRPLLKTSEATWNPDGVLATDDPVGKAPSGDLWVEYAFIKAKRIGLTSARLEEQIKVQDGNGILSKSDRAKLERLVWKLKKNEV